MSNNQWWFLIFVILLVLVGFKVVVWLLTIGFLVWLVKAKEVKNEDVQSPDSKNDD